MTGRLVPFNAVSMRRVPNRTGTYFLFLDGELLCAGVAAGGATLRSELEERLAAPRGERRATQCYWIEMPDALTAYRLQLAAYAMCGQGQDALPGGRRKAPALRIA